MGAKDNLLKKFDVNHSTIGQIEDYLFQCRLRGYEDPQIVKAMVNAGWEEELLKDLMNTYVPKPTDFYPTYLSEREIWALYGIGFNPSNLSKQKMEKMEFVIRQIIKLESDSWELIGTGFDAVVLKEKEKQVAYKFSERKDHELELFEKLKERHGKTRRVVNLSERADYTFRNSINLEYIEGHTLERQVAPYYVGDNIVYPPRVEKGEILNLAKSMLGGLLELRAAGIFYHRDLRPANIIVDRDFNSTIIDLGIAATEKHAPAYKNRRFGATTGRCANDLVSLGQILYYVDVRDHLFKDSKSMSDSVYALKIRDSRDEILGDRTGKKMKRIFERVEKNVFDTDVKEIVFNLLECRYYDYKKAYRMVEEKCLLTTT